MLELVNSRIRNFGLGIIHNARTLIIRDIELLVKSGGTADDAAKSVPEVEKRYPQNLMFGTILPAYGLYVRHADGVRLENVTFKLMPGEEKRQAIVADDAEIVRPELSSSGAQWISVPNAPVFTAPVQGDSRAASGTSWFARVFTNAGEVSAGWWRDKILTPGTYRVRRRL